MILTDSLVGGYGIVVSSSGAPWISDQITISGNEISNTAGSGIYLKLTGSSTITSNVVLMTCKSQDDADLNVAGIAANDGAHVIVGNVIRTSAKAGISFGSLGEASTGTIVASNYCTNCLNGIVIRGNATGFVIRGNTLVGCTNAGVFGWGDSTYDSGAISDNYITNSGNYGVILNGVTLRCAVTGNIVTNSGLSGVTMYGSLPSSPTSLHNLVAQNIVMDSGSNAQVVGTTSFGIDARGLAYSIVSNNLCGNSIGGSYQDYGIAEGQVGTYAQLGNAVTDNNVSNNATRALDVGALTLHKGNRVSAAITTPASQLNGVVELTGTTPVNIPNPEAQVGDAIVIARQMAIGALGHISATVVPGTPNSIQLVSTASETSWVYWEVVH